MRAELDFLTSVAEHIGTERFYKAMMGAAATYVPSDDFQVIHYPGKGSPLYVVDDATPPGLRDLYKSFSTYDPFLLDWRRHHRAGIRTLNQVQPPDYDDGGYCSGFYDLTGYADEVGLMFPALIGSANGVFLQRARRFSRREIGRFERLYPALRRLHAAHRRHIFGAMARDATVIGGAGTAVVEKSGRLALMNETLRAWPGHEEAVADAVGGFDCGNEPMTVATRLGCASVMPLGDFPMAPDGCLVVIGSADTRDSDLDAALESFGGDLLSRRERQITRLVFAGYASCHIAETLGISEATVKNIRKRLYYKMDVTSERELFALFLEHLRSRVSCDLTQHGDDG